MKLQIIGWKLVQLTQGGSELLSLFHSLRVVLFPHMMCKPVETHLYHQDQTLKAACARIVVLRIDYACAVIVIVYCNIVIHIRMYNYMISYVELYVFVSYAHVLIVDGAWDDNRSWEILAQASSWKASLTALQELL